MRVVSFNLMAPAGPFFPWGSRPRRAAELLAGLEADLIGTQEATPESLAVLGERLPEYAQLGRGRRSSGEGIQCAVLYRRDRFRLVDSGHFWMSERPEVPASKFPGMGSCRVATWAVFEGLSWVNVHFSHFRRRRQARLLLERLRALPRPWLVTGDFNGTSWPPWSSARVLAPELVPGGSGFLGVDRVLTSEEFRCQGAFTVPTWVSDHRPVVADYFGGG